MNPKRSLRIKVVTNKEICFKGNIIDYKFVLLQLSFIITFISLLGFFYLFFLRFWLSNFASSFFYLFLGIAYFVLFVFLLYIYMVIIDKITLPRSIRIILTEDYLEVFNHLKSVYKTPITDLTLFVWNNNGDNYGQINIASVNKPRLIINIGSILNGNKTPEFKQWIEAVSNQLQKQLKTTTNQLKNGKTVTFKINRQLKKERLSIAKVLRNIFIGIFLILFSIAMSYLIICLLGDDDPDNEVRDSGVYYENSNYKLYNNQVYFLNQNKGYFRLKNSDHKTFRPLHTNIEFSSSMGVDTFNVYFDNQLIEGINRTDIVYLGGYYIKDNKNVFFKNELIEGADPQTTELIPLEYRKGKSSDYSYAKDKHHVYYEGNVLEKLNPEAIKFFNPHYDYIADSNYVYYRGKLVDGMNPRSLRIEKIDYKLLFSYDDRSFWLNNIKLRENIKNRFVGTTSVDRPSLKLMVKKGDGSGHMIFYNKNHIIYFNEYAQDYFLIKEFEEEKNFQKIANGIYSVNGYIYFFMTDYIRAGSRNGGSQSIGLESDFVALNTKASDFKFIKEIKNGTIWTDGKQLFFNYNGKDVVQSTLYIIDKDLIQDLENRRIIPADSMEKPKFGESLFTVSTKV